MLAKRTLRSRDVRGMSNTSHMISVSGLRISSLVVREAAEHGYGIVLELEKLGKTVRA